MFLGLGFQSLPLHFNIIKTVTTYFDTFNICQAETLQMVSNFSFKGFLSAWSEILLQTYNCMVLYTRNLKQIFKFLQGFRKSLQPCLILQKIMRIYFDKDLNKTCRFVIVFFHLNFISKHIFMLTLSRMKRRALLTLLSLKKTGRTSVTQKNLHLQIASTQMTITIMVTTFRSRRWTQSTLRVTLSRSRYGTGMERSLTKEAARSR